MADDGDVSVEVTDVLSYGQAMGDLSLQETSTPMNLLATVPMMAMDAFADVGQTGMSGTFAGGEFMVTQQLTAQQAFLAFLGDALRGLWYLGSAATVVAHSYRGTDENNASTVNDVGFAFGVPGAARPAGLPRIPGVDERTWGQHAQDEQLAAAAALRAPASEAVEATRLPSTDQEGTVDVYVFADGSRRTEFNLVGAGPASAWGPTVVTTTGALYTAADRSVLAPPRTTVTTATPAGRVVTVDRYENGIATRLESLPGGGHRTTTRVPDPGHPDDPAAASVSTVESAPPTASGDPAPVPVVRGPLEEYEATWGDGIPGPDPGLR